MYGYKEKALEEGLSLVQNLLICIQLLVCLNL